MKFSLRFKSLVILPVFFFCSLPAFSEILLYNWSINGEEYISSDDAVTFLRKSKIQNGYMVVEFLPALAQYQNAMIVKFWQKDGKKLYSQGKFLNGSSVFSEATLSNGKKNLLVSSFAPGALGEFYSGAVLDTSAASIGGDQDISIMQTGFGHSTWEVKYVGRRSVMGGGAVTLKLNKKRTSDANQSGQTVEQVVSDLVNEVQGNGYVGMFPVASDDQATTRVDTPVAIDVLKNDFDPQGEELTVNQIISLPSNGSVLINTDKTITYTPDLGFFGTDLFSYEVIDESGGTDTALVTVTVLFNAKTDILSAIISPNGNVITWANGDSTKCNNISFSGRFITFKTRAKNLGSSATNVESILMQDRILHTFSLVNTVANPPGGTEWGNQDIATQRRIITSDMNGRYVVFASENIYTGDVNGYQDIWVRDLIPPAGAALIYSVTATNSSGEPSNGPSGGGCMSGDGTQIAFHSSANNLVSGDTNKKADVFVYNSSIPQFVRMSVSTSAVQADGDSLNSAVSIDGRFVVFESDATNLVSGDTNGKWDVFLHDRDANNTKVFDTPGNTRTIRVSVSSKGEQGDGNSYVNSISDDGRYVVFSSDADNLDSVIPDTNGQRDVFVYDTLNATTVRVNISTDKSQANGPSDKGVISDDGSLVVFESTASNLDANDVNGASDIFTHNQLTGITYRNSVNSLGVGGNGESLSPTLASDGYNNFITYYSNATNLGVPTFDIVPDTARFSNVYMQTIKK